MKRQGVLIKNIVITRMPTDGFIPKEIKNFEKILKKMVGMFFS